MVLWCVRPIALIRSVCTVEKTKIGARIVCVPAQCVITVTASPDAEKNDSSETKKGGEEVDAVVG